MSVFHPHAEPAVACTCLGCVEAIIRSRPCLYNLIASTMEMSSTPSRPLGSGQSRRTSTTRPWTAQSRPGTTRPGTARPQTAASTRHEGSYVIALLESRGVAHEVGIAAMDRDTGRVMLVQVGSELCLTARHRLIWGLQARRLSNLRQNAAPDAHSLPFARSRP